MNQFSQNNFNDNKRNSQFFWLKLGKIYLVVFLFVIVFIFGLIIGTSYSQVGPDSQKVLTQTAAQLGDIFKNNPQVDPSVFSEAWQVIHDNYLDKNKIDDQKLFYGSISGMVDALGDQHTIFLTPQLTQEFTQELDGSFYGIGAEIGQKNNTLVVIAPLDGSPAEKAGLKAGDRVLSIDGEDTTGMSVNQAVYKIRGEKGKAVELQILSKDSEEAKTIKILRDKIDIPSVKYKMDEGIAVIEISNFNSDTADRFGDIAQKVLRDNPKGIILDLRNNPGGFLNVAVDIASSWLEPGQVVVRETYGDKRNDADHRSSKKLNIAKYQTVVLVNEGSASASEILAGALQDYSIVQVVGEKTFGKGSVQQLMPLKDNSAIKLTIARWLTPKGRTIEGVGIAPDIEVKLTTEDYNNDRDPQLDKAKELILQ